MKKDILIALGALVIVALVLGFRSSKSPEIVVTAPQAGDIVNARATTTIAWESRGIPSDYKVAVHIRRAIESAEPIEGQEFDPIIFVDLPNTGSVEWLVSDMYTSGDYILELSVYEKIPVTNPVMGESGVFTISQNEIVGGDRDEHGCIPSAGYSWCEARSECIRSWETYCTATKPKKVVFACDGGKEISASFYIGDDKFVDLVLSDGRKLSVPRTISASGARYAKADESFVFWNKGDTAFITEGVGAEAATTFANCVLK